MCIDNFPNYLTVDEESVFAPHDVKHVFLNLLGVTFLATC